MSVIRRSMRFTSLRTISIMRARESSLSARVSISTALLSEVRGFFSSCATSAAKRSIASMRSYSARVMADRLSARSPISSRRSSILGIVPRPEWPLRTSSAARASR